MASERIPKDFLWITSTLLAPGGILLFLTHARRFRLDPDKIPAGLTYQEITKQTIPPDFQRKATFHRAWEFWRP